MKWEKALELGATKLAAILGCPVTTAHSWIRRSGPLEWQKPHYLRTIECVQMTAPKPAKPAKRAAKPGSKSKRPKKAKS